ncbi:MAG: hypothetical protein HUU21_00650 [Polyangiaceae bacterium]|nr:hypothetical protein [Polyangiaceae bacterium]
MLIDEELKALIPRLSPEELAQLEQNILAEGCRDKLVVWDDGPHRRLLDGHNRLDICTRHDRKYEVDVVPLRDREAAIQWVLKHQLGRRNLSPEALSYLRGRLYIGAKRQGARTDLTSGQIAQKSTTSEQLAAPHKVDEKTIRRDAKFAEEIDELAAVCGAEIKQEVLARNARITRKDVKPLLTLLPSSRERVIAAVREGAKASTLLRELGRHSSESSPGKPKKTEGALGGEEAALQSVQRATRILGSMSPGAVSAEVLDRIEAQVQSLTEEIKRHRAAPTRPDGSRVDVLGAVEAVFELENEGLVSAPLTNVDVFFADPSDPRALHKQLAEVRGMINRRAGRGSRSSMLKRRAMPANDDVDLNGAKPLSYKTFNTIQRYLERMMPELERLYNQYMKTRADNPEQAGICERIERVLENGGSKIVDNSFSYVHYLKAHCTDPEAYQNASRATGQEILAYLRALNQAADKILQGMRHPTTKQGSPRSATRARSSEPSYTQPSKQPERAAPPAPPTAISPQTSASGTRPASTPPFNSTLDMDVLSKAWALMESAPPDILHRAMRLAREGPHDDRH